MVSINKEKNFASGVIYVHNAEKNIEKFLGDIIYVMESNFEHSEIICVNDFSRDNSLDIIKKTAEIAKTTSVSVVNMSYFHGLELAMNAGVDISIGDFVFEFDSTNREYDLNLIMDVYRRALQGYDIVSAAPNKNTRFSSTVFYRVYNKFSRESNRMRTESFRVLSRRVINRISSMNKTTPYRKAVYANCGLQTDYIEYEVKRNGNRIIDKEQHKYRSSLAVDSLILFTDLGYQFSKIMSLIMICMTLIMFVYTVTAFIGSTPVEGWTSTVLFLSVVFFGLFVILTIIIKYLQLIVELVFKRKHYSFENIEKLTK